VFVQAETVLDMRARLHQTIDDGTLPTVFAECSKGFDVVQKQLNSLQTHFLGAI